LIRKLLIAVLVVLITGTALALEPVDLNKYATQVPDIYKTSEGKVKTWHVVKEAYGEWEQLVVTTSGTYHIVFHEVHDTWKTHPGPQYREIHVPTYGGTHTIHLDLRDTMDLLEIVNPKDRIALLFKNSFRWTEDTINDGHSRWFFHVDCLKPFIAMKSYWVMKPKSRENYFRESITYKRIVIDLSKDKFVDKQNSIINYEKIKAKDILRSLDPTPDHLIRTLTADNDKNGILDAYQAKEAEPKIYNADGSIWLGPKFLRKHRKQTNDDSNDDLIRDNMQNFSSYTFSGNSNFIDINGDNLCDNYSKGIYNPDKKQAMYTDLTHDLRNDPFQSYHAVRKTISRGYVDINKDGINDQFQKMLLSSHGAVSIYFIDENNDTISDYFQTMESYLSFGLTNFVDVDGDGLCDNYLRK